jgi:hypothetical protein
MHQYVDKEILSFTSFKINLTTINEVDWENLPLTIGTFSVALITLSGDRENLQKVEGTLVDVFQKINEFDNSKFQSANIIQEA